MDHDVIIIGGSFAGLSAAIYLARARRKVCVLDTGLPRNRFAPQSHGFFAQDGNAPEAMLATARLQVAAYPTVELIQGKAETVTPTNQGFSVTLADGQSLQASKLILAFGLRDELPAIPGLAERWGKSVLHCPYCHGFEFSGQQLGVLAVSPLSVHQAMLIAEWGPTTLFLNGQPVPDAEMQKELTARGVQIETTPVTQLTGAGAQLGALVLADGREVITDALYIGVRSHLNSPIAAQLGCQMEDTWFGQIIKTDEFKMTSVPGVYAAGDIARGMHSATWASADGVTAGTAAHRELVFPQGISITR
ncbi:thioredoxin reductase [Silvimonas terrae]|uniref:Thioredoxin reductase n=1 Tax=Silvimonas terrae TaxID=300266 RepID=A0A840RM85_9NEIS|nr:NAD(P)/FAD-dependent oxidoreductase [Silvimonas terrae]MBB5193211.1 thioredoxin reductase [Silvimonas terrae]